MYLSGAIELEDYEKRRFIENGQKLKYFSIGGPRVTKVEAHCFKIAC